MFIRLPGGNAKWLIKTGAAKAAEQGFWQQETI